MFICGLHICHNFFSFGLGCPWFFSCLSPSRGKENFQMPIKFIFTNDFNHKISLICSVKSANMIRESLWFNLLCYDNMIFKVMMLALWNGLG